MSDRNYFDLLDSSVHNPNGLEAILGKFRVPGTASTSTSPRAGSPPRGAYDDYGRGNWGFPLGADAWVSKLLGRKLTLCGTRDDVKPRSRRSTSTGRWLGCHCSGPRTRSMSRQTFGSMPTSFNAPGLTPSVIDA